MLTRVDEIRRLTTAEAAAHHPVRLVATVTYHDHSAWNLLFVEDATGGIFVDKPQSPAAARRRAGRDHRRHRWRFRARDRARHGAVARLGAVARRAPAQRRTRARRPRGQPLGRAEWRRSSRLLARNATCSWIVVSAGLTIQVNLPGAWDGLPPLAARRRRSADAGRLWRHLQSAAAAPRAEPLHPLARFHPRSIGARRPTRLRGAVRPIGELLQFASAASMRHRVTVRGQVTFATSEQLFVQDETGSLKIRRETHGTVGPDRRRGDGGRLPRPRRHRGATRGHRAPHRTGQAGRSGGGLARGVAHRRPRFLAGSRLGPGAGGRARRASNNS